MRKKRYIVAILLLLVVPVMLGNISWASDTDNAFSLARAISVALDPDNEAIKELEWKEDEAQDTLSEARSSLNSVNENVYTDWYKYYSAVRVAEANLDIARRARKQSLDQITINVQQAYFNAVFANEALTIGRKKSEQSQELFRIAETRYNKGLSTKKEFLTAQINFANSKTNLADQEREKDLAFLNLKKLMNIEFGREIMLTSKLTHEPMEEFDPERAASDALQYSSAYLQAEDLIEAYEDIIKQAKDSNHTAELEATSTYDSAETQLEKWRNQKDANKSSIKLAAYKAYINLINAEDKIKTYDMQIELAEEVAKIARLSYRAGSGTLLEANDALIKLDETKLDYQKALHAYNTAKASFEANIF